MKGFKSGDLLSENGRQIILLSLDGNSHVEDSYPGNHGLGRHFVAQKLATSGAWA